MRQTQSFLIQRFEEAGIRPETRHGQNFLIDLNLLDLLVETAGLGPSDVVLEVGTGLGSLTIRMAAAAGAVVTVEIDTRLFQMASEQLGDCPNVVMLQRDALRNKNHMDDVSAGHASASNWPAQPAAGSRWSPICLITWRRRCSPTCCCPIRCRCR